MSGPGRLLLVEDDRELRDAVALVLRARGWDVEPAGSAESALAALAERSAEAVVADLGLPDRSGPGLVAELRAAAPGARLVAFTGRDDPDVRRACLEAGADDYLVKPVGGGELAELLSEEG